MRQIKIEMCLLRNINGRYVELNADGVFVYTALRVLLKDGQSSRLTYKDIYLSLCNLDNIRLQNKIICKIKSGLTQLVENGLIKVKNIDKSTMSITPVSMKIINNNLFFSIPIDNINKIMEQNDSINLLYKYLYIASTINIKSGIGFYSQENIASNLNMSIRTINRAFKTFCDLEILFKSSRSSLNKKGEFINMTNIYSLDKECLEENQYNIKAHKDFSDNVIDMDKYINKEINYQNNDVCCDFDSCPF